jgi:DNA (cytosine-5)-methyltransferase 1
MNLYNEIDPKAAAWIGWLIDRKAIPHGIVIEKGIAEVTSFDLRNTTQCHLFAGIGGWSEALRLAGWPAEANVWTGSCPCQPFSSAGKQRGESDERHLWPEFRRLVAECRPPVVFGEQVASRLGREWLARVRADLEGLGYVVGAADLCAAGEAAPHLRQRLYWGGVRRDRIDWMAHDVFPGWKIRSDVELVRAREVRTSEGEGPVGSRDAGRMGHAMPSRRRVPPERDVGPDGSKLPSPHGSNPDGPNFWSRYSVAHCRDGKARRFEPGSFPLAHGVPNRVGLLRGYGNAIVPQVAARFIRNFCEAVRDAASRVTR